MNTNFYNSGKFIFALSIICIGMVHLIFKGFPIGFEPVPATVPVKITLAYIFGSLMIISALLIFSKRYTYHGSVLSAILFLIIVLGMHLPKVLSNIKNASLITGLFEGLALLSGSLMLIALSRNFKKPFAETARIIFIISLVVFGVLHCLYMKFIETLIPAWLPLHAMFDYLVILGFFGAAIGFLIRRYTELAGVLLSAMFLIWFVILHLPRAIASPAIEPEWTSAFVALAMGGISLLVIGISTKKAAQN